MKKFLISTIVVTLVATLMGVFVACGDKGGNNDAETAQKAITAVRQLYGNKAVETPADYKLNSTQRVDKLYDIKWTVSSDYQGYADYIKVGTTKDDKGQITVSITQADDVIEYKLIASVTVGKATKSTEFTRKVPAKAAGHAGTAEDPYQVANVKEIGAKLAKDQYYEVDGAAKMVWVEGYVVDIGDYTKATTRVNDVYIVDEYAADKDKNSSGAQLVYSITYDDTVFTGQYPLMHGDKIVVKGFIQLYGTEKLEVTYKGNDSVYCTSLIPAADTRTDEQKVNAAVNGATLAANKYSATGNDIALPVSSVRGVTLGWAVKETNEYATVTDNKLNIIKLPTDGSQKVVLVATATLDGTEIKQTKEFEITVEKGVDLGLEHAGTEADPYTVADANKILATLTSAAKQSTVYQVNGKDQEVYVKGFITNGGTVGSYRLDNAYIADSKTATQAQSLLVYGIDWDAEKLPEGTTLTVGDEVVIKGYLKDYNNGTKEIAQSGSGASATYPKLVKLTAATDDRTPAEKVAAVKTALTLETSYSTAGKVNLPAASVRGVTVTWASDNTSVIAIATDNKSMTITLPDAAATVKVTATIKYGTDAEDTKEFTITVSKTVVYDGAGTQANPYSVGDVQKILNGLTSGKYFTDDNGNPKQIYFTGYVTVAGTADSYGNNNVYVGATANATQAQSVLIWSLNWDKTVWVKPAKLYVGDQVTVRGYLTNHSQGGKEVSDNNASTKDYPVLVFRKEAERDDARKIADAIAAVPESLANVTAAGAVTLPTSSEADVTFVWSLVNGNGVVTESNLSGNTLTVSALPESEDKIVTLKVTASCGTAKPAEKEVTVKVNKGVVIPDGSTTVSKTVTSLVAANPSWTVGGTSATQINGFDIDTNVSVEFSGGNNTGKVYKTGDVNEVRIYQNENPTITIKAKAGYKIVSVKVTYLIDKTGILCNADKTVTYDSGDVISVNGTSVVLSVKNSGSATNGQVKIQSIEVTYIADDTTEA